MAADADHWKNIDVWHLPYAFEIDQTWKHDDNSKKFQQKDSGLMGSLCDPQKNHHLLRRCFLCRQRKNATCEIGKERPGGSRKRSGCTGLMATKRHNSLHTRGGGRHTLWSWVGCSTIGRERTPLSISWTYGRTFSASISFNWDTKWNGKFKDDIRRI